MTDSKVPDSKKNVGKTLSSAQKKSGHPEGETSASTLSIMGPVPADGLPLLWDESAHKIPLSIRGQPFRVTIPTVWPGNNATLPFGTTTIRYFWGGAHVHTESIQHPYDPAVVFPFTTSLPAWPLDTFGITQMYFEANVPIVGAGESDRTLIDVDNSPPNHGNPGAPLLFSADILDGVSDAELAANGGIPTEVPPYLALRTEDEIMFYLGALPHLSYAGSLTVERRHIEDGDPLLYLFPEGFVRNSGGGNKFASYRLKDRAGNIGPFSAPVEFNVDLVTLPDLLRPLVPRAEADGLIDLDDIRQQVTVAVREIVGALPGDTITLYWNTHILATITVGATQIWPIPVDVEWSVFLDGGFASRYPVRVWYEFTSGPLTRNSLDTFIEVDATVAGEDPIGPDPINPTLPTVTVKGVTEDNVITPADSPGPVLVEVFLFFDPVLGEDLQLFWGNDASYADIKLVNTGDVAGQLVKLYVQWALIVAGGGLVDVYYWTNNGVNRQRSAATRVRVELDTLTGLVAPSLQNDHPNKWVACDTNPPPHEAVIMGIPWDTTHFDVGDTIRLFWSSHRTTNGGGVPIPGTEVWFELELTDDHRTAGMAEIKIEPFDPLITEPGLIPNNGSGLAYYRLYKAAGPTGKSASRAVRIDLIRPNGSTCLGTALGE